LAKSPKRRRPETPAEHGRARRVVLITQLEEKRDGRLLISYITSTRPGFEVQMGDDVLPFIFQALEAGKERAQRGVDLFLHSNGGSGTVPWRIVNLIREYTKDFSLLVPHHAFSAATLTALGADRIIMHRMGCLGPIDPSVANAFNPPHPQNPAQLVPISVEDVSAYFTLIKEDIGVQHEDELIQAVIALTDKIHPLALGNVQRSHKQSRLIANKLLRKHMPEVEREHEINQLVENLKSNLFFHGHPINRVEARDDLKIKAEAAPPDLEAVMWDLYQEYVFELKMTDRLNALHEWDIRQPPPEPPPGPLTTQEIVAQLQQLAQAGVGLGPGITAAQLVELAVAMLPHVGAGGGAAQTTVKKVRVENLKGAYLETVEAGNVFLTDLTYERDRVITPQSGSQDLMKQELLWQRWEQEN
jgi:hypothetical protein